MKLACGAMYGDRHEPFLQHMQDVVCAGDPARYVYLVKWMARAVQQPDTLGERAIVLCGPQGSGKTLVPRLFGELFGDLFVQLTSCRVFGMDAIEAKVVVFLDEFDMAGWPRKKVGYWIKSLISEERLVIETMGKDARLVPSRAHVMMAVNTLGEFFGLEPDVDTWHNRGMRRFVLFHAPFTNPPVDHFAKMLSAWRDGGRENLLHFLLALDITGFDVRDVPQIQIAKES